MMEEKYNIETIIKSKNCYGCMACKYVCNFSAISFSFNKYGFYEPLVDKNKCKKCGACLKTCQTINTIKGNKILKTYYGWSKDHNIRNTSASGGAFYEIAKSFIEKTNGTVYGASFSPTDFTLEHIKVDNVSELPLIQGSKYIQSDISNVYKQIKQDLQNGKKVLFSGTPCQVQGIRTIFNNNHSLYCVDLICYGFLSNGAFKKYMLSLEENIGSKIHIILFRNKKYDYKMSIHFDNGKTIYYNYRKKGNNGIYGFFLNFGGMKETCNNCKYRTKERVGDLTLSDYPYSISNNIPNSENGVSVIYINNDKGAEIFNKSISSFNIQGQDNQIINYFLAKRNISKTKIAQKYFIKTMNNKVSIKIFASYYSKMDNLYNKKINKYSRNIIGAIIKKITFKKRKTHQNPNY